MKKKEKKIKKKREKKGKTARDDQTCVRGHIDAFVLGVFQL